METIKNEYIPGVCNMGMQEIKRRMQAGWGGAVVTIIVWGVFVWLETPAVWRLALFFPASMSAMGFVQAYSHFCAYFGFASLFNVGNLGKTDTVVQAEFRSQDRRKAWQIVTATFGIGVAVALLGYFLV